MKRYLLWSLLSLVLLCACSDDDTPIDADDNFITSVTLTTNDNSYDAVVGENDITVTVPYNVSLDGAKATFVYTPSAKIYPNPQEITNWNEERIFRVVSYNGEERQYKYLVVKSEIAEEGNVVLKNASDIAVFASKGTSVIKGSLTIGADKGEDITSLSGLENLKEVAGTITILDSYKGTDLTGLDNLKSIGGFTLGSSEQYSNVPLYLFSLNSLETITGDINLYANSLELIDLKDISKIDGSLNIATSKLKSIKADKLEEITNDFVVNCKNDKVPGGEIMDLSLPLLVKVGGKLSGEEFANLQSIYFPKLQSAGAIIFENLPFSLENIQFDDIATIDKDLILSSKTEFHIIGTITTGNTSLRNLKGFNKLSKVGGTIDIIYFTELENIPNLSNAVIGGIHLSNLDRINILDLSGTTFISRDESKCKIKVEGMTLKEICGSPIMDCDFLLDLKYYEIKEFPKLSNINEIGGLYLKTADSSLSLRIETSLKKINGNLQIDVRQMQNSLQVSMPNLESIEGYAFIRNKDYGTSIYMPELASVGSQIYTSALDDVVLTKLRSVCSNSFITSLAEKPFYDFEGFTNEYGLDIILEKGETVSFPKLEKVGGNGMKIEIAWWDYPILKLEMPLLTQATNNLIITGPYWGDYDLSEIVLPEITNTGKVEITQLFSLFDFSSFAKLFINGCLNSSSQWNVSSCGYNPTFEDMKAGRYKPTESAMQAKSRGLSNRPSRRRVR